MKTLGSGSDTMRVEEKRTVNRLVETHGCHSHIMEGYGMTEVGSAACTNLRQCDVEGSNFPGIAQASGRVAVDAQRRLGLYGRQWVRIPRRPS